MFLSDMMIVVFVTAEKGDSFTTLHDIISGISKSTRLHFAHCEPWRHEREKTKIGVLLRGVSFGRPATEQGIKNFDFPPYKLSRWKVTMT
jgi:hypothetical protein